MCATKKKGLGRGLDELLGGQGFAAQGSSTNELSVDDLHPGRYQPRGAITEASVEELAESIRAEGVITPILVRQDGYGYEIIAGERRWRAAVKAGLEKVPVRICELSDNRALIWSLIENMQRKDLNPIEEARGLQRLVEEFRLSQDEVACAVGRSRPAVSNLMRLLHLPQAIQDMVSQGKLEMGHARALLGLEGSRQAEIAEAIIARGLSVREAEALVRQAGQPKAEPVHSMRRRTLEKDVSSRLGAKVRITQKEGGCGRIVIEYENAQQLKSIVGRF